MNKNLKYFTVLSLFTAFSIILGYVEYLIPFNFGIYGFKIGLSNIASLLVLYLFDFKSSFIVLLIRIFVVNTLFGTGFSLIFSLIAGALSLVVMWLLHKLFKGDIIFVSAIGGIFHNIVQVAVATILISQTAVLYLIPFLVVLGLVTGVTVGIVSKIIYYRTNKFIRRSVSGTYKENEI